MIPIELIDRLRAWFFYRDRDIAMQSGRTITLGDGRIADDELNGIIPSGGVIFWPSTAGAIPSNWTTFSAAAGRFLIGASGSFADGSTGGASTININHYHTSGTLATSSDGHTHGVGTLSSDFANHSHGAGTLAFSTEGHTHDPGTLSVGTASGSVTADTGTPNGTIISTHDHSLSGSTASDSHDHTVSGGTGSYNHAHSVSGGTTASDSHGHSMSGYVSITLSSAQSILPPYLVGTWIQKS